MQQLALSATISPMVYYLQYQYHTHNRYESFDYCYKNYTINLNQWNLTHFYYPLANYYISPNTYTNTNVVYKKPQLQSPLTSTNNIGTKIQVEDDVRKITKTRPKYENNVFNCVFCDINKSRRLHNYLETFNTFSNNQNVIVGSLMQLLFDCDRNEISLEAPINHHHHHHHQKLSYAKVVGSNTNKIEPMLRKPKSTMIKLKLKSKRQNMNNNSSAKLAENGKRRLDDVGISQMIATDPDNEISQLLVNKLNRATVQKSSRMPYTMNFRNNL